MVNYLKSTQIEVGLLLNFGLKPEIKRKAFDNTRKKSASISENQRPIMHLYFLTVTGYNNST